MASKPAAKNTTAGKASATKAGETKAGAVSKGGSIKRHLPSAILNKAVEANGFVFLSGIVPTDLSGGIKAQTKNVLDQIDGLLEMCGSDRTRIVQSVIWVPHIASRDELNEVWIEWTGGSDLPARACVEAKLANPRILVEIMVTAVK